MERQANLKTVRDRTRPWDIVVIGGGATGAGCALDAASRGFDVLLLEQHDFGKGTSSRSTKLIHGGVRYLRQGNISLVREALRERFVLLQNAPHVVRKQQFIIPCYGHWQKAFYGVGMKVYDMLAERFNIGRSRFLSCEETLRHLPNLDPKGLRGGVLYYDCQFDDTRLLIDIIRTANGNGASVLNYARVTSLSKNADGKVKGLELEDAETGEKIAVQAESVINATGAFCDGIRQMSDDAAKSVVTFAQGIHLVFDQKFLPSDAALMIPKTSDGRVLFCIPWHEHLLVGTTDTPVKQADLEPKALETEIDFVIDTAGRYLAEKPGRKDIHSVFAGIRPLIKYGTESKTSALSRGHDLFVDKSGLVTTTGGKWTTYRQMAEDAVNKAVEIAKLAAVECKTERLPILPPAGKSEPGEKLHPDLPYTRQDITRAVREEMAITLEDVLARRTRVLFFNAKAAIDIAPKAAKIMAAEIGHSADWAHKETERFIEIARNYLV